MGQFDYLEDPTYRALLAAVKADPRDNLPRLVMADWLEENGQEVRANCIRHQISFRSPGWTGRRDHHGAAGRWRAERLTPAERGFPDERYPGLDLTALTVSRGWVSIVRCGFDEWAEHGTMLATDQPIQRVVLAGKDPLPTGWSGLAWFRGDEWALDRADGWELPPELFDCLPPSRTHRKRLADDHNEHEVRCYPSWASAENALTRACLAYALAPSSTSATASSPSSFGRPSPLPV